VALLDSRGQHHPGTGITMNSDPRPRYTPILGLPYWGTIGPFVDAAVEDATGPAERELAGLYSAVTPFVLWCWQSRGIELRRERMFRRTLVDQFIHLATPGLAPSSKATLRGALWRMVETLNPTDTSVAGLTLPRSAPTLPYSAAEVAELLSWAASQSTARRREDAAVLLALGFGAGLATRELLEVTVRDITARDEDVFVSVWAGRPRVVPVLPNWRRALRDRAEGGGSQQWAFRRGRSAATSNQVTDFVTRAATTLDVRPVRMRATWLSEHLATGTSPVELLSLAGLQHLSALQNALNFAPRTRHNRYIAVDK